VTGTANPLQRPEGTSKNLLRERIAALLSRSSLAYLFDMPTGFTASKVRDVLLMFPGAAGVEVQDRQAAARLCLQG